MGSYLELGDDFPQIGKIVTWCVAGYVSLELVGVDLWWCSEKQRVWMMCGRAAANPCNSKRCRREELSTLYETFEGAFRIKWL
jgi:hypothetical protein